MQHAKGLSEAETEWVTRFHELFFESATPTETSLDQLACVMSHLSTAIKRTVKN